MTENDTAILEVLQAVQDFKDGELSERNLINYLTDTEFEIPSREYRVCWTIDLDAESPEQAAEKARAMQMNPESIATVFNVSWRTQEGARLSKNVDLLENTP